MNYPSAESVAGRENKIDWDKLMRLSSTTLDTGATEKLLGCRISYMKEEDSVVATFYYMWVKKKTKKIQKIRIEEMYGLTQEEVLRYHDKLNPRTLH